MDRLIILPGYAKSNGVWAEEMKMALGGAYATETVNWKHWEDGDAAHLDEEPARLGEIIGNDTVFVLAKSIGTLVGVRLWANVKTKIRGMVMCGVPLVDIPEPEKKAYQLLAGINPELIAAIQNNQDPHGSYVHVRDFLQEVNPGICVVEKRSVTHDYYYKEDFLAFFDKMRAHV